MAKKKKPVKAKPAAKTKTKKPASKPKALAKPVKVAAKKAAPKAKKPEVKAPVKKVVAKKAAPVPTKKAGKEPQEAPPSFNALADALVTAEVEAPEEIVLTDAEGRRYCRVKDCDQIATVDTYCRYHYLLYWKKIQVRKKILSEGKLERYIEELTARYPDKFLDMLRKDLRSEKEFLAAIAELEIDESATEGEFEDEAQNYIDEVRGISETSPSSAGDEEGF